MITNSILNIASDISKLQTQGEKLYSERKYTKAAELFTEVIIEHFKDYPELCDLSLTFGLITYMKLEDNSQTTFRIKDDTLVKEYYEKLRENRNCRQKLKRKKIEISINRVIALVKNSPSQLKPANSSFTNISVHSYPILTGKIPCSCSFTLGEKERLTEFTEVQRLEYILKDDKTIDLFSVIQGYNGGECALFVRNILSGVVSTLFINKDSSDDVIMFNLLKKVFTSLQDHWDDPNALRNDPGAMLTLVLKIERVLWTASIGFTRAVLAINNQAVQLSEDTDIKHQIYKRSMIKRGGKVQEDGVDINNEKLPSPRSIHPRDIPFINPRPKIKEYVLEEIEGKNIYLILGSRGFWSLIDTLEVVDLVSLYQKMAPKETIVEALPNMLINEALKRDPSNNITILSCQLNQISNQTPSETDSPKKISEIKKRSNSNPIKLLKPATIVKNVIDAFR